MQNPSPINLTSQNDVRKARWAAEARDADGHLISMCSWGPPRMTHHESAVTLAEFVTEYATDYQITLFAENMPPTT